jgi:prepilin-type N-terminal cleavage/methylation domain-containing protein
MSHNSKSGFTLIELMLAMTFISVLLIAIAMTTIQISTIYNRGITLREVNQVGRSVSDDLRRSIASSTPFDVTPKTDNSAETASSKYVVRDGGGRLCIDNYTYAWNYGSALAGGGNAPPVFNTFTDGGAVGFVKVTDPGGGLCTDPETNIERTQAVDLISSGDRDLVIHEFTIQQTSEEAVTGQALYALSMTIGTNERELLLAGDASCKPPADAEGGEEYCAVNRFDMVVRAGNRSGGE